MSWILFGISVLLSALALVPTREGIVIFTLNVLILLMMRFVARRGR